MPSRSCRPRPRLRIEDGTIREARLALGGVAAKPWRARAAEDDPGGLHVPIPPSSAGRPKAALADAKPSGDNAFKIELAQRIIVRALTLAAAGTPQRAFPRCRPLPSHPFPERLHDA